MTEKRIIHRNDLPANPKKVHIYKVPTCTAQVKYYNICPMTLRR